jgi:hypothetical protein
MGIGKIVSGGQTGIDRAGLDVAIAMGISHGGWCPQGKKAEDGTIPPTYRLQETPKTDYRQRTEWNVRDSDGTLILTRGQPAGGTAATIRFAADYNKPCLVLDLTTTPTPQTVRSWLKQFDIQVLNVAGPRESGCPGIQQQAVDFLQRCLKTCF